MPEDGCRCLAGWVHYRDFEERFVGVDRQDGRFGEVTILTCRRCGQHWLRYHYELEAFTASGRWWRGPVSPEQAAAVTAETALATLGTLAFYYVGGSYYDGRVSKSHGPIVIG
jgi:hypothetical protein